MGMMDRVREFVGLPPVARSEMPLSLDEYLSYFTFNGSTYGVPQTLAHTANEPVSSDFTGLDTLYKTNGVVSACITVRQQLFSEARFMYRQMKAGRPGDLVGDSDLDLLAHPFGPTSTTSDLLNIMSAHVDLAGNSFVVRRPGPRLAVLRPDWVTLAIGSMKDPDVADHDVDAQFIGLFYTPGGPGRGRQPEFYPPEVVAHLMPMPDPTWRFRGITWMRTAVREVLADSAARDHKLKFFENGATPNMVVKLDINDIEKFDRWVEKFNTSHQGTANAYRTLFLGAGADAEVVGLNFDQMDFKTVQGAGETRIAAAAGVPPVIVGLSEGLQAATYSNYGQARRRFADGTMRPLWRNTAGSLANLVPRKAGKELWYDAEDIPFLAEDVKDAAEVQKANASTLQTYINSGFEPDAAVDAVVSGDPKRLMGHHSGFVSVQMQDLQPAPPEAAAPAEGPTNGAAGPPTPTNGAAGPTNGARHLAGKHDQKTHGSGGVALGGVQTMPPVSGTFTAGSPHEVDNLAEVTAFVDAHQTPNPAAVRASVASVENGIRNDSVETAVAIMPDGEQVFSPKGTVNESSLPTVAVDRAAVLTHNHPSGSGPSPTDLDNAFGSNLQEVRVTSKNYDYSVKPGPDGWGDQSFYRMQAAGTQYKVTGWDRPNPFTPESVSNAFWTEVAPIMGWNYTRTARTP